MYLSSAKHILDNSAKYLPCKHEGTISMYKSQEGWHLIKSQCWRGIARDEDIWSLLAIQSSHSDKFEVQQESLSQSLRWGMISEDISCLQTHPPHTFTFVQYHAIHRSIFRFYLFEALGIDPRVLYILSKPSTTELQMFSMSSEDSSFV